MDLPGWKGKDATHAREAVLQMGALSHLVSTAPSVSLSRRIHCPCRTLPWLVDGCVEPRPINDRCQILLSAGNGVVELQGNQKRVHFPIS